MKVFISMPPLDQFIGDKTPQINQNRQYQEFAQHSLVYPVLLASAATLLKSKGYDVVWDDAIAKKKPYYLWIRKICKARPDIVAIESKTPCIKYHWQIAKDIKTASPDTRVVLIGDHVSEFPEESLKQGIDFVIKGGDYDILLLNLLERIEGKPETKFESLDELPFVDRDLTCWKDYAFENGNFKMTPGSYVQSGRDCFYGKCTFCLHPSMEVITNKGIIPIKEIVESGDNSLKVLTHKGVFRNVINKFNREHDGNILNIKTGYLSSKLILTSNHNVYGIRLQNIRRCSKKGNWTYLCLPNRISRRLKCVDCDKKYYEDYKVEKIRADKLIKGDMVAIPIDRKVKDKKFLDLKKVIGKDIYLKTKKLKSEEIANEVIKRYKKGDSQRSICIGMKLNRECVNRYINLYNNGEWEYENGIVEDGNFIKYKKGKKWILRKIPLSNDFMRFIGYYLAEGHVTKFKNRPNSYVIGLTFSKEETEYVEDVLKVTKRLFRNEGVFVADNKVNNTKQINIHSPILAKVLKKMFGENCYNKQVPNYFLQLPLDKQRELLDGVFRGDGHLRSNSRNRSQEYILSTCSKGLAKQVFYMLIRQDIIPRLIETPIRGKATVPQYTVTLYGGDIKKVFPDLQVSDNTNYRKGFIFNDYIFVKVEDITKEKYKGKVYNLEIEGDHSYTAENIAVANCSWANLFPLCSYRRRSPENVVDEIKELVDKYKIREVFDDSGTFPCGEWLTEFCNLMISSGLSKKVRVSCNMRFGILKKKDYILMRRAGFRFILFGAESGNQETLDLVKKGIKVEDIIEGSRWASEAGLNVHLTCMINFPNETREMAQNTINLVKDIFNRGHADSLQATQLICYPNTELYRESLKNNMLAIPDKDWELFDMRHRVLKSPLEDKEINELISQIYKLAFQPKFILRQIGKIRCWDDILYIWRGFKAVVGKHLKDFK